MLRLSAHAWTALVVDDAAGVYVGQRLKSQPITLFLLAIQDESACFMIQPRERSRRSANWSTFSASGTGTCAVSTRVSVFAIVQSPYVILPHRFLIQNQS